jgi:hypothetical protein
MPNSCTSKDSINSKKVRDAVRKLENKSKKSKDEIKEIIVNKLN